MASWACRSLTWIAATYLAQGGHLSGQRLDHPHDLTNPRPRRRATGRDRGLWAAIFATNAILSRIGEGHPKTLQNRGLSCRKKLSEPIRYRFGSDSKSAAPTV